MEEIDKNDGGELINISEYMDIYESLDPETDGIGYFVYRNKWLTEDEVSYKKLFNGQYTAENEYTHVMWYS